MSTTALISCFAAFCVYLFGIGATYWVNGRWPRWAFHDLPGPVIAFWPITYPIVMGICMVVFLADKIEPLQWIKRKGEQDRLRDIERRRRA